MLVGGLVGGFVATELPIYHQYLIRSRVAEGLVLARPLQSIVVENFQNGLALNSGTPGVDQPVVTPTESVRSITVAPNGEITITYSETAGDGTLVLVPMVGMSALAADGASGAAVVWHCNSAVSARAGSKGTLAGKYVPAECRN